MLYMGWNEIGGSEGLFAQKFVEMTSEVLADFRNQGTVILLLSLIDVFWFPAESFIQVAQRSLVKCALTPQEIRDTELCHNVQALGRLTITS
jgi:hypothetical protein